LGEKSMVTSISIWREYNLSMLTARKITFRVNVSHVITDHISNISTRSKFED
jgi:hypothetical protein